MLKSSAYSQTAYTQLFNTQKKYIESGATRSYGFRMKQLKRLKQAVKSYEEQITEALHHDLRKAPAETYVAEIGFVYEEINYALEHLKEWMKFETVKTPLIA